MGPVGPSLFRGPFCAAALWGSTSDAIYTLWCKSEFPKSVWNMW